MHTPRFWWNEPRPARTDATAHPLPLPLRPGLARLMCAGVLGCALWTTAGGPLTARATPLTSEPTATARAAGTSDDWPTFLHDAARSGASGDTTLAPANVAQLTQQWAVTTGGAVAASAAVVAGTLYVGSWDGEEYALDAATGTLKWKTYLGITHVANCVPPTLGISSAAAVRAGVVYVGGGDSYWYALDAGTGAVRWRIYTGDNVGAGPAGGHYNWSSPLLYKHYAYIGIASLGDCPLVQGELLKVDLTTHAVAAVFRVVPDGQIGGGIWTSPALDAATNTIYVTTGTEQSATQPYAQALLALDATTLTLKAAWKLPEAQAVYDSDFGTSPLLFQDATGRPLVGAINKNGVLYAFARGNLAAGPVWQQAVAIGGDCPQCGEGSVSSGAFAGGRVYFGGGNTTIAGAGFAGSVQAFDPATGAPLWQHGAPGIVIPAVAAANGLIFDGAGSLFEVLDAATGTRLFSAQLDSTIYGAPVVAEGRVYLGTIGGTIYAFGLPTTPPPPPPPDPQCPAGWTCQDLGAPLPAGSESAANGVWTVVAGGVGVGGAAGGSDQLRLLTQPHTGDTQVVARVDAVGPGTGQAGVIIRQRATADAPSYAVYVTGAGTGTGTLVVAARTAFGAAPSVLAQQRGVTLPVFVEIERLGDQVEAGVSSDGSHYTLVGGSTVTLPLPATVLGGALASSGAQGTAGSATLAGVAVGAPSTVPVADSPGCLTGWSCADIGNPAQVGAQSLSGDVWTVTGGGSDIWNSSDQFHYVWQPITGDTLLTAHLVSQTDTDPWAKAGLMLRASAAADAPYYAVFATPGNGLIVQARTSASGSAFNVTALAGAAPAYLRIASASGSMTAYTSSDGLTWTAIPNSGLNATTLRGTVLAGLAVTAHNPGTTSTATFDGVALTATCPAGWTCGDIGAPTPAGSESVASGTWTLSGGGADIWNIYDQFHYAWQPLAGDGTLTATVTAQSASDPWAKAGLMLRLSTDPAAPFYAVFVTPGNGLNVQYRASQGATAQEAALLTGPAGTVPVSLRITRSGTTLTAFTSSDGVTWVPVAGSTLSLPGLSGSLLAGLAVTSHNTSVVSVVTLTDVSLSSSGAAGAPPTLPAPAPAPAPAAATGSGTRTAVEVCLPHPRGSLLIGVGSSPERAGLVCGLASPDQIARWARWARWVRR